MSIPPITLPFSFGSNDELHPAPANLLAQRVFLRAVWKSYSTSIHEFTPGELCMEKDGLSLLRVTSRHTTALIFVDYADGLNVEAATWKVMLQKLAERGTVQWQMDCLVAFPSDDGSVHFAPRDSATLRPLTDDERAELAHFDALDGSGAAASIAAVPVPTQEEAADAAR